jgi:hypothetical protein
MSFLTKSQILLSIDICIVCSWSLSKNKNKIKFYLKIEYLLYKSASTDRNMYEFQSKSKKYGVNIYNDLLYNEEILMLRNWLKLNILYLIPF